VSAVRAPIRGRDVIEWRDVPGDVGPLPIRELYRQLPAPDALRFAVVEGPFPVILVSERMREKVLAHLRSSEHERGGLLIGTAWHGDDAGDRSIRAVSLVDSVAAEVYASSAVSLRLDADVWERARAHVAEGRMVVGWYHSHPHIGAFFSAVDRRTQRGFFHHPWSVGWVIDPFAGEGATLGCMFIGADAEEASPASILMMR